MRKSAANGILWIVTVSAAAVAVATRTLAQGAADVDRYFCGPHMMWWNGGSYGMIFGPFFMILGLAVVIALIVLLGRWLPTGCWCSDLTGFSLPKPEPHKGKTL